MKRDTQRNTCNSTGLSLRKNISNPKPKYRLLINLAVFITLWRSINPHSSIIGMLDANADSTDLQFKAFIANTALNDVVSQHSPEACNQITYSNGKNRLDYSLVSEDILLPSTGAGHTPYGFPFISDHRGVYWDIPFAALNPFSRSY